MTSDNWQDGDARCLGMMLDGRAQATGIKRPASDATLLLIFNSHHDVVPFALPQVVGGRHWELLIDTEKPDLSTPAPLDFSHVYEVSGRSLLLLALQTPQGATYPATQAIRALVHSPAPLPTPEEGR